MNKKEVNTSDLVGHEVTINRVDYSQAIGKVIKVSEQKIILNFSKGLKGIETNVWLTILDENGKEHTGKLPSYDNYLTGSIYSFTIKFKGETINSCGGFFGSDHEESGLLYEAKSFIDYMINKQINLS